jgi:Leucine-rich repeat (LRR) protein
MHNNYTFKPKQMKPVSLFSTKPGVTPLSLSRILVFSLLLLVCSFTQAIGQTATIPDPNFRQFLVQTYPEVMDANQQLIIAEAAKVDGILQCEKRQVKSLEGVQYFTGIYGLYCEYNELTSLPNLSGLTQLVDLRFSYNKFTVFPNLATIGPKLQTLSCRGNQLTSIPDLSGHKELVSVGVGENQLTSLPDLSSLTKLYTLTCDGNKLTQLPDLSRNTELVGLWFSDNQFTTFPNISANAKLSQILCGNNQLTSLPDFSKNPALVDLMCENNQLTSLPDFSKNTSLGMLECRNNKLTALPNLSANIGLHTLLCSKNQLTALPALPSNIMRNIEADFNQLTVLPNFSDNMGLVSLSFMNNRLTALPDLSNHTKLALLQCSNNPITSLPDLSKTSLYWLKSQNTLLTSLPKLPAGAAYDVFFIEGNQLTFEDILPILPVKVNQHGSFNLYPQAKIGTEDTVTLKPRASHTIALNIDNSLTNNAYEWYIVENGGERLIATTSKNTFTFSNVSLKDAGVYKCKVTNPGVGSDTFALESHLVTMQIDEPWIPVISGGENHLIVIPKNIPTTINGAPIAIGDYIGIFFEGSNGNLTNGGMVQWTGDHLTLNAWGSNATPKNGFSANEAFKIKVWRTSERKEYTVDATYTSGTPYTHTGSYAANGFSGISSLSTPPICVKQIISLHAGWNLVSINVQPDNLAMRAIFAGIADVLVKDAAGRIQYAPQNGITNGTWNILEGYKVLVPTNQTLTLCGAKIDPLTSITIPATTYPYFLPYFASVAMPVTNALNSLGTNYNFVQSNEYRDGSAVLNAYNYLPAHVIDPAINQIGMMRPGLAYKVSMTNAIPSFRYPAITVTGGRVGAASEIADISLSHYPVSASTTGNNALLIVPKEAFSGDLTEGDEIAVYSTNGTLAGAGRYTNENMVITIWENQHMLTGEKYNLKVWKADSQEELVAEATYQRGNGNYISNSIQMVQNARLIQQKNMVPARQVVTYPNPTNSYIYVKSNALTEGPVTVSLVDLMGVEVVSVSKASFAGVKLDVHHLPAGQYICVIKSSNGKEFRTKVAVSK